MKITSIVLTTILFAINCFGQTNRKVADQYFMKAFKLNMDATSGIEAENRQMLKRAYLDSAINNDRAYFAAYQLKLESFKSSSKLDSAIIVCNKALKMFPQKKMEWLSTRGRLYKDSKNEILSKNDYASVKRIIISNLNTIDTLQKKNASLRITDAFCALYIGEKSMGMNVFQRLKIKFPEDAYIKKTYQIFLDADKNSGNGKPTIIWSPLPVH